MATEPSGRLAGLLSAWPTTTATVGVLSRSGSSATAGPTELNLPWASLTKLLTSLTVLDACADGTISLDEPAGPSGSTVRHLLAHSSGLPFEGAEPVSGPGRKRIYSNTGYEVLAAHLAAAAGGPFADELHGRVLKPLQMPSTQLAGSPASGATGPLEDLLRLAGELLSPTVLGVELVDAARTVAFPGLDGVLPGFGRQSPNDWGLGCEIRDGKSPHWTSPDNSPSTFGHFGQSGSFLWVDPAAGLACASLCDKPFGPWAGRVWPAFSTAVLRGFRA